MARACCVSCCASSSAGLQQNQLSQLLGSGACLNNKKPPNNNRIPAGGTTLQQTSAFLPAPAHPNPGLSQSYILCFLPEEPQGFLPDWSQFWKGRDISNFADLGLGGCCGLWAASSQLGGEKACVYVCVSDHR